MEFLFFIADADDTDVGPEFEADARSWVAETDGSGARIHGNRLRPAADATVVKVRGGEVVTSPGAVATGVDWIAGFDVIEAADLEAAIEIARRHPMARAGQIEIRPVWPFE
ncbi:hypothetical protein ABIE21_001404 [Conyzicola nivalis]|uniref:YCII-related domain-containing protein n=1 Tax=Conyzicola nivalis TaxID=1477021 RepID=A0ABV2QLI7_9MICO